MPKEKKRSFVSFKNLLSKKDSLSVVGLGYVGLPLLVALSKKFQVIGFDLNKKRVEELSQGVDINGETESRELKKEGMYFTSDEKELTKARFHIIAVPTPINHVKKPDLKMLESASRIVGRNLLPGSIVVYESTVYPGLTEEICVPILAEASGLEHGRDFKIGYSPERINPGDKEHAISRVVKVVAGQDPYTLDLMTKVYGSITTVFKASTIRVAEAAKVIENTQRDLNIALMNELSLIFHRLGIDTKEVLATARTKWNFLPFAPGLVGGHCIGVDPYYLTYKASEVGYLPEVILAGRRINDGMGSWIATDLVKCMTKLGKDLTKVRVLIMGVTFKENVSDIRNSKVFDIIKGFSEYGVACQATDPMANPKDVVHEYGMNLTKIEGLYDLIILSVPHKKYKNLPLSYFRKHLSLKNPILADLKGVYKKELFQKADIHYWRL